MSELKPVRLVAGTRGWEEGVPDTSFEEYGSVGRQCRRYEQALELCEGLIDLLSVFYDVSSRQLRSERRTSEPVCRVRQIGMYVAHVTFGMKMDWVADGFRRDRSTVVHACHAIEDLRDDEDFDILVARTEKLAMIALPAECGEFSEDE
ncbi:helix-turn-helix domain-containing protein [Oricola cellulosilytica]|uniref:Chromosomal replication initiator DnaA C-terminal domain-containing protein n=1 Tax=Oricola cellulosilytica TaxID=1429082 RepID=A0A4V2MNQ4_9HYPH|nr:helix-turn-helix domain-containing protein [Oricola cellulosilytica]TCD14097.1 hypothetical protein E0D97_08360 [Oricola cellulosilytica]